MGRHLFELSSYGFVIAVRLTWILATNTACVGLGSASKEVTDASGRKTWVNPLVKAKGKLLYSKGRMGRAFGDKEWEERAAIINAKGEN